MAGSLHSAAGWFYRYSAASDRSSEARPVSQTPASLQRWREPNVRPGLTKYAVYVTSVSTDKRRSRQPAYRWQTMGLLNPIGALHYPSELRDKD